MLRSMTGWSGLINSPDDSIQMAYTSLIANSKVVFKKVLQIQIFTKPNLKSLSKIIS